MTKRKAWELIEEKLDADALAYWNELPERTKDVFLNDVQTGFTPSKRLARVLKIWAKEWKKQETA